MQFVVTVTAAEGTLEEVCAHLQYAANGLIHALDAADVSVTPVTADLLDALVADYKPT